MNLDFDIPHREIERRKEIVRRVKKDMPVPIPPQHVEPKMAAELDAMADAFQKEEIEAVKSGKREY